MLDDSAAEGWRFSRGFPFSGQACFCWVFFAWRDRFHYPRHIDSCSRLYDDEGRWVVWCQGEASKRRREEQRRTRRYSSKWRQIGEGGGVNVTHVPILCMSLSPSCSVCTVDCTTMKVGGSPGGTNAKHQNTSRKKEDGERQFETTASRGRRSFRFSSVYCIAIGGAVGRCQRYLCSNISMAALMQCHGLSWHYHGTAICFLSTAIDSHCVAVSFFLPLPSAFMALPRHHISCHIHNTGTSHQKGK